jgi:UPF0716 protein FxsA
VLGRLFLLFTLVPLVELYLLVTIGGWMGAGPTIALVAVTGIVGAWLARREGRKALVSYQESLAKGQLPEEGIVSGLLILAGGVLLITPGVLTDMFGLAMMIPPIRRATAKLVKKRAKARIESGELRVVQIGASGFVYPPQGGPATGPSADIVDAEVVVREHATAKDGALVEADPSPASE